MNCRRMGSLTGSSQSMLLRMCGDSRTAMGALLMPWLTRAMKCPGVWMSVMRKWGAMSVCGGMTLGRTVVKNSLRAFSD